MSSTEGRGKACRERADGAPAAPHPASASARAADHPDAAQFDAGERLLRAAGPLFADRGFASVSTRALSQAAGVNLSAISYHFGTKGGLYRAVLERLVADLGPVRETLVAGLGAGVAEAGGDRRKLAGVLVGFVRVLVAALAGPDAAFWRMQLIQRELQAPSPEFEVVMEGHIRPIHGAVDELVAAATRRPVTDEQTRLLAQSIIALCLQVVIGRNLIRNRLDWDDLTPERVERVTGVIAGAALGMLGLPDPS